MTDIKVFLLFLLDNIRYPVDHTSLIGLVSENTEKIIFDYDECLRELVDSGHIYFDEYEGERYYMISESGTYVATELYDTLDKEFRETYSVLAAARLLVHQTCGFYESIYRVPGKGAHRNANLYYMKRHVNKLVDEFVKRVKLDKVVNENEHESIKLAVRCVNRRIIRFVNDYIKKTE